MRMRLAAALAVSSLLLAAGAVSADVTVQQKTQVKFEGMLGRMLNLFGGKAARDGLVQTVVVQGDRKATITGDTAEIVDLAEEKVYDVNLKDKSYRVRTFAEIRREMEEAARKAREEAKREKADERDPDAKEMQVDFDVKSTGQQKTVNGYQAREVITTITVHEKGKTLEQAGGIVMTATSWLAPAIAAMKEVTDFDVRYAKQLSGSMALSAPQMMQAFAMYPGMQEAVARFEREKVNLEGTPVQTTVVLAAAGNPEQAAGRDEGQRGGGPGGVVGGVLGRFGRKKAEPAQESKPSSPGRQTIMTSTTETLKVEGSANPADLQVPAGFKLKK